VCDEVSDAIAMPPAMNRVALLTGGVRLDSGDLGAHAQGG
jgi:hypothetical protein